MMKQSELISTLNRLLDSPVSKSTKRRLLQNFQICHCYQCNGVGLAFHEYRFEDGPFIGQRFISTAPIRDWLDKYDNLRVIFLDCKLKGIETTSLICFDRKIEKVQKEWRKLLSIYPITWQASSVAGFQIQESRT
ncbi:hypothetical protein [Erwinia phage FBB1]|nr:hypothetical protein [Erwinia phage FBB1]